MGTTLCASAAGAGAGGAAAYGFIEIFDFMVGPFEPETVASAKKGATVTGCIGGAAGGVTVELLQGTFK